VFEADAGPKTMLTKTSPRAQHVPLPPALSRSDQKASFEKMSPSLRKLLSDNAGSDRQFKIAVRSDFKNDAELSRLPNHRPPTLLQAILGDFSTTRPTAWKRRFGQLRDALESKVARTGARVLNRIPLGGRSTAAGCLHIISGTPAELLRTVALQDMSEAKLFPESWGIAEAHADHMPEKLRNGYVYSHKIHVYQPNAKRNSFQHTEHFQTDNGVANWRRTVFYTPATLNPKLLAKTKAEVLDIGTGGGKFVLDLRKQGVRAFGVDLRLSPQRKMQRDIFFEADASRLPFEDQRFDVIYSKLSIFSSIYDGRVGDDLLRNALMDAVRVLKPGGFLRLHKPSSRIKDLVRSMPDLEITRLPGRQPRDGSKKEPSWDGIEIRKSVSAS
jgi:SAM-dependent methyltransferase